MPVTIDLLEDQRLSHDADGYKITRTAIVTGLSGAAAQLIFNAINNSGIPLLGDSHPFIPDIVVTSRSAEQIDRGSARVTINYSQPDALADPVPDEEFAQISVSGGLVSEETTKDNSGKDIGTNVWNGKVTPVTDNLGTITGFNARIEFVQQSVTYSIPRPTLRFQRKESINPVLRSLDFVGTVNSFGIWNGAARTWLCTGIDGSSSDGGVTYDVTYEFTFNLNTWDIGVRPQRQDGTYPIESTAKPGEDFEEQFFSVYDEVDFGRLGLAV